MDEPIYLDYNATTPLAAEVIAVMQGVLANAVGNPSSGHWAGSPARETVEQALAVDLLSLAGHEFYAPKGIGGLYIRRGIELSPVLEAMGVTPEVGMGPSASALDAAPRAGRWTLWCPC